MKPTPEQIAIFQSQAEILKIKAGAGTGKTTTLRGLAATQSNSRMLYLAFNKAIKEEAQARFPRNVRAMTAHGLAYGRLGKYYGNIPNKLAGDLKPFHVLPEIKPSLSSIPPALHNLYGGRVIDTIKAFLVSPDFEMGEAHLSLGASPGEKKHFSGEQILQDAFRLWEMMIDTDHKLPMIHDGYLKLFQLEEPDLDYDVILLDEAQDTNPVTQALVERQWGRKVYVGDEHQAIYGFRGARNAMALIEADEEHFLTGSFRFGSGIARVANAILVAKGEQELRLRGLGKPSRVAPVDPRQPHTYISRGNSALFSRAVQALDANEQFAFVGPLYSYRLDLMEQTYGLMEGRNVSDPFLKAFSRFEELEEYAEALEDREWMGRCKLVSKYSRRIPYLVSQIQARAGTYPDHRRYQVVLTTAHRAKGLEFDRVILADDFMDFFDDEQATWKDLTEASEQEKEEVNLQYVAATRSRSCLEVGEKLERFLEHQFKSMPAEEETTQPAPARVTPTGRTQAPLPQPRTKAPRRPGASSSSSSFGRPQGLTNESARPGRESTVRQADPTMGARGRPGKIPIPPRSGGV